jgi:hypothetical protein
MSKSKLEEAIGHLGAAIVQSSPKDDQIILGHIREAHAILKKMARDMK